MEKIQKKYFSEKLLKRKNTFQIPKLSKKHMYYLQEITVVSMHEQAALANNSRSPLYMISLGSKDNSDSFSASQA